MPRLSKSSGKDFEPRRKNAVSLGLDSNLDNDFKAFKIGDAPSGLEFNLREIRSTAENFITQKETTQELHITKMKGNLSGSTTTPSFIFQNSDETNEKNGLWFNNISGGSTLIKANGESMDAFLAIQCDSFMSFVAGADDGDVIRFQKSSDLFTDAVTVMNFDIYNTHLTIYDRTDSSDYFKIDLDANGVTTISTNDSDGMVGHLTLDAAGEIYLDAEDTGKTNFKDSGTTFGHLSVHHAGSYFQLNENGGASEDDYFTIACYENGKTVVTTKDNAGADADLIFQPDGSFLIQEKASAGSDTAGYGQLWVRSSTPNDLYFVDDTGQEVRITNNGSLAGGSGGTQYWNTIVPGYSTNKTSTTNYYTFYRNWYENWSNSDSDPTTISSTDSYSCFFIAPRAGSITNVKITGYASDVGYDDPFKFYFYKASLVGSAPTVSLTAMFNTSTITPAVSGRTWIHTEDFSSSNTFAEDDMLYCWWKKDSNSGSQDVYFTINVNGEYS